MAKLRSRCLDTTAYSWAGSSVSLNKFYLDQSARQRDSKRLVLMSEHSFSTRLGKRPRAARLPKYVQAGCQETMRDGCSCENRAHWEVLYGGIERPIFDGDGGPLLIGGGDRVLVCGIHCRTIFKRWEKRDASLKAENLTKRTSERAIKWALVDPRSEATRITRKISSLRRRLRRLKMELKYGPRRGCHYRKAVEKAEKLGG